MSATQKLQITAVNFRLVKYCGTGQKIVEFEKLTFENRTPLLRN